MSAEPPEVKLWRLFIGGDEGYLSNNPPYTGLSPKGHDSQTPFADFTF
jgi:hypothetical protein